MHTLRLIIVALLMVFPTVARAAPATTLSTQASTEIESLINLLSADSYQTRQEAQEKLVRFGDDAVPRLQLLVRQAKDGETRTRAEAALAAIEENRTVGTSIVTLKFTNAHPKKVIEELARQGFASFRVEPQNLWTSREWPPVSFDIDKQPFWQAMRTVCTKVGLRPQSSHGADGPGRRWILVAAGGANSFDGPVSYSGPFMVVANSITQTNTVLFGQPQNAIRTL